MRPVSWWTLVLFSWQGWIGLAIGLTIGQWANPVSLPMVLRRIALAVGFMLLAITLTWGLVRWLERRWRRTCFER